MLRRSMGLALAWLIVLGAAATASTGRGMAWDGTWAGGWDNGDGVQLTFVGDKIISVYRHGDYPDITRSEVSADRKTVNFAWSGGEATLQRLAEDDARITIRKRGRPERSYPVKRE
jgi:hypothetical protein